MIGLDKDLLLVYTGLGTQYKAGLDLGDWTGEKGLLLDNEIEKHVLYLKRNNKGFEFAKG
jgi:hypothetical protein